MHVSDTTAALIKTLDFSPLSEFLVATGRFLGFPDRLGSEPARLSREAARSRGSYLKPCHEKTCLKKIGASLFLSNFAANQLAGIIVVLDDVDVATLLRVALH